MLQEQLEACPTKCSKYGLIYCRVKMAAMVYTVCAFHPYVQPDAPYRAGDTILEVLPATVWSSMIAELQLIHRACCRVDARVLDTTKS